MHRSGFVNIIGNPNVGKSTLMNALVGEKLSIITSKAQTTRHRIMGIVSGEDFQIVYSDTPGILKPSYKLQESMMKFVTGAVTDADVILYVTDTVEQGDRSAEIIGRIRESWYKKTREMLLFFYYPSDEYISYLMTVEELEFLDEIDCQDLFEGKNQRERILVFQMGEE